MGELLIHYPPKKPEYVQIIERHLGTYEILIEKHISVFQALARMKGKTELNSPIPFKDTLSPLYQPVSFDWPYVGDEVSDWFQNWRLEYLISHGLSGRPDGYPQQHVRSVYGELPREDGRED